jgi:hypothetical protein
VGLDPLLALMPDRTNVQLIFLDAKRRSLQSLMFERRR